MTARGMGFEIGNSMESSIVKKSDKVGNIFVKYFKIFTSLVAPL